VFGSWGDYALLRRYRKGRNQFKQDSKFHNVPFPIAYPHVNLKQLFSEAQGLPKRYGMAEALQLAGIEKSIAVLTLRSLKLCNPTSSS
jgi:inhibitor of KinA sporulation pathway (predicted exonuclease)